MTVSSRWRYRAKQFAEVGRAKLGRKEVDEIAEVLTSPLLRLFLEMHSVGQRHGYRVFKTLRGEGYTDPDLLSAALLHDVGKGYLGVLPRVLWVLLGGISPVLRQRLALHPSWGKWLGLRDNFFHAAQGAEMVHQAQGSLITIWLIAQHEHTGHSDPVLLALQRADDDS